MLRRILGAAILAALLFSMVARPTRAEWSDGYGHETNAESPIPGYGYAGQVPVTVNGEVTAWADVWQPVGSDGKTQAGGGYATIPADSELGQELQKAGARVNEQGQILLNDPGSANIGYYWEAIPGEEEGSNENWRDANVEKAKGGGQLDLWWTAPEPSQPDSPAPPNDNRPKGCTNPGPDEVKVPVATYPDGYTVYTCVKRSSTQQPPAQSGSTEPAPAEIPGQSGSETPSETPTPPPGGGEQPVPPPGGGEQPAPPPPPPEEPVCEPRSDRRRVTLALDPTMVKAPGYTRAVVDYRGSLRSDITVETSWGYSATAQQGTDGYYVMIPVPTGLKGPATVTASARLSQSDGCGDTYGPSTKRDSEDLLVLGSSPEEEELAHEASLTPANLSLEAYLTECLGDPEPWYCGVSPTMAQWWLPDLQYQATWYRDTLGPEKWRKLVERVDRALVEGGGEPSGLYVP